MKFKRPDLLISVSHFEAHHRLYASLIIAGIACLFIRNQFRLPMLIMITWIIYAVVLLIMVWLTILTAHPKEIRQMAKLQDSSRTLIFIFVIFAACVSILAVILLMSSIHDLSKGQIIWHVVLSFTSVVCSWLVVHSIFAFKYAHLYYTDLNAEDGLQSERGLRFPQDENPDYLDFAYFSFIIGMTCQVADVEITGKKLRRLALVHGLLTFGFNTIIVALTINVISGLLAH